MKEPSDLSAAYRAAHYRVAVPTGTIELQVDQFSPQLLALQRDHRVHCSACITACNPASHLLPEARNRLAMAALTRVVDQLGLKYLNAEATDPAGVWPAEPSLLVLGMDASSAVCVARDHGQLAVVAANADGIPRLLWTGR